MTRGLAELLRSIDVSELVGDPQLFETTVNRVVHDSRAVGPGDLFCCVPGEVVDGHEFAGDAVAKGAVALLCERRLSLGAPDHSVAQAIVPSTRVAMGPLAAAFYDEPSRSMDVVGVTGTNGKTTTTHLLQAILEGAGRRAEVIGTLTGVRTTPEATDLQESLATMRDSGVKAVAMEVSSHALDQHRVDGTWYRVAVFTNLSGEHLDYHGTMDAYFAAKAALFEPERAAAAVINIDDPWGRRLADQLTIPWEPCSLGLVEGVQVNGESARCRWRDVELRVPMGGRFNLANALGAAITAELLGVEPHEIARGLAAATPVRGRFERVDAGQPFTVIVDYAHTPDGLEQVVQAAREIASIGESNSRLIVVFGAGGQRDPSKRAPMGEVVARLADLAVLTSDNPRHEDPGAIIDDVRAGFEASTPSQARLVVEPDRRAAITLAFDEARPGDIVVLAGKGHETTQVIGDDVIPFDDRAVARELLESRRW